MILLEDCPKASIIESRYMANYIDLASNFGGCVEFTSVYITHCHDSIMAYTLNQTCINLVNFLKRALNKISVEIKKRNKEERKKLKLNLHLLPNLIPSFHLYNKYLLKDLSN